MKNSNKVIPEDIREINGSNKDTNFRQVKFLYDIKNKRILTFKETKELKDHLIWEAETIELIHEAMELYTKIHK